MTWRRHAGLLVFSLVASLLFTGPSWAIQCAPYARDVSGIDLYGSAWTWWRSADGVYARGKRPVIGAAMVFKRKRGMPSGHVAVVTEVLNSREVTVDHANWAPRGAARGRVLHNMRVIDVSVRNDWSEVRVWFPPVHSFGNKVYPVYGFIYPTRPGRVAIRN